MNNIRDKRVYILMISGILLALGLIIALGARPAWAAGSHPVTVQYKMAAVSEATVKFDVYKIGTFSGKTVKLDSPFNQSGVTIVLNGNGSSSNEEAASAQTLYQYIKAKKVGENKAQHPSTDANGNLTFQGEDGCVYLLGTEEMVEYGGRAYKANPIFMTVGGGSSDEADLKSSENQGGHMLSVNTGNLEVTKHWTGDSQETRPSSIEVELYENNELKDTVTLNAANNWTYTWEDPDGEGSWTCIEKVPDGYTYTVLGTNEGNKDIWMITNTADIPGESNDSVIENDDPDPTIQDDTLTGKDTKEKKKKKKKRNKETVRRSNVRTGDPTTIRWAIIAMALSGFALIVVAVRRKREE